ncbi:YidC/Oxa1 family membrane protein insertase [Geosporobacter ferrireducens]|uniref:YidC/Oxa1 family membrane protein insertase n=1 Tax=Geosporobacter ferrireducens TaxID=1424294 RepID=UPI00235729A4|nr:YidC/Oxa1 family membrane protein insertase [Geosporobacter ferrireducens]
MNIIFEVLHQALGLLFHVTGDWGLAIVLLTIIAKLALLPVNLKQKNSLAKQQEMSKQIEALKNKYKHNKEKLEVELQKVYTKNAGNIFGGFAGFIQLPILISLYRFFIVMPVEGTTIILPWILKLSLPAPYYIVPILVTVIQLLPNILVSLGVLRDSGIMKLSVGNILPALLMSVFIVVKAPIGLGLYFLTSAFFSAVEQICFTIYVKKAYSVQ